MLKNSRRALLTASLVPFISLIVTSSVFYGLAIQKKKEPLPPGTPVIWRAPGDVGKLDFVYGSGGREKAPKPPFTFLEENLTGSNPKIQVRDAAGVKWSVKFGQEVNAEIFATRIVWAAGYFTEHAYFVASGRVDGVGELKRAKEHIKPDGSFTNARFERGHEKGVKHLNNEESWSWVQNPFIGSKELNGLKVVIMLLSNWDNKDVRDLKRGSNTAIFRTPLSSGVEDRYLITDWGASMGKWGGYLGREKWDCKGYTQQTKDFIKEVKAGYPVWGYSGQHTKDFTEGIRSSDVQWLMQYLGQITDEQLRQGLQASGATPDEVECFTMAIRARIDQLKKVAGQAGSGG